MFVDRCCESEPCAFGDQSSSGKTSESVSQIHRRGYHQRFEFVNGRYPGGLGAFSGGFQHSQGFSVSPNPRDRRPRAAQDLAGGPPRVEGVGLGAVAAGGGVAELEYPLIPTGEKGCYACSVASRAFHGPCSVGGLGVLIGPFHQPAISLLGGLEHAGCLFSGGPSVHHRRGYPVTIRIDPYRMFYRFG